MKTPVLLLAPLLLVGGIGAQDSQGPNEPETTDQFFFFIAARQFKPLEEQTPTAHFKSVTIPGNRSTFRCVQGDPLAFVIRLSSDNADPSSAVQLFRLKPQGDFRAVERTAIPFEALSFEENSVKIKPKVQLGPGEYALSVIGKKELFCFAVDAVSKTLK